MESRLWRLYNLIKDRSEKRQYLTIKDICMLLPKDYEYDDRVNTHCENTQVYKDINLINKSNEVEKIILTDKNKIHLAINKTECEQYIKRMENHLWNEYNKYLDIKRKDIHVDNKLLEQKHASKISKEKIDYRKLEFGTRLHSYLEAVDFVSKDTSFIQNQQFKKYVDNVINNPLFVNLNVGIHSSDKIPIVING